MLTDALPLSVKQLKGNMLCLLTYLFNCGLRLYICRLAHEPTGLRIHFLWEKSCAFMIDPLFFEMLAPAPVESYLVDWAPKTTTSNGRISKAVTRHTKDDDTSPALHVFSYVSNQVRMKR